jgi:hypothetical protein
MTYRIILAAAVLAAAFSSAPAREQVSPWCKCEVTADPAATNVAGKVIVSSWVTAERNGTTNVPFDVNGSVDWYVQAEYDAGRGAVPVTPWTEGDITWTGPDTIRIAFILPKADSGEDFIWVRLTAQCGVCGGHWTFDSGWYLVEMP